MTGKQEQPKAITVLLICWLIAFALSSMCCLVPLVIGPGSPYDLQVDRTVHRTGTFEILALGGFCCFLVFSVIVIGAILFVKLRPSKPND